jgi:hypothetical protein
MNTGSATGPLNPGKPRPERPFSAHEQRLIAELLTWCGEAFETGRARFVRRLTDGRWTVHSLLRGALIAQPTDQADVAMAWLVGLSRQPLRAFRPRLTALDGQRIRPIAVTTYLGIPVICQDEFLGVVEMAGNIPADLDGILREAKARFAIFAERLVHDRSLRGEPAIDLNTEIELRGGLGNEALIEFSQEEWRLVSQVHGPSRLGDIASSADLPAEEALAVAHALYHRRLLAVCPAPKPDGVGIY